MARELANSFTGDENEMEAFKRFLFGKKTDATTTTTAKITTSKYDAEEVREINLKTESRRMKAFKNYEESCSIKGKFKVRSCPKLEECYAKNKLKFVPLASAVNTTTKPLLTTTSSKIQPTVKPGSGGGSIKSLYPHFEREFLERALASRFLRTIEDEPEDEEKPFKDRETDEYDDVLKRFLLGTKSTIATTTTAKTTTIAISKELAEETKERRGKAFKKYEEYCEKRKFRFGATRNCPQLDDKLC